MKKEFEEFSRIHLKKYGVWADICDKHWNNELNDYLYCLDLDESINDDLNDKIMFSLTYAEIAAML